VVSKASQREAIQWQTGDKRQQGGAEPTKKQKQGTFLTGRATGCPDAAPSYLLVLVLSASLTRRGTTPQAAGRVRVNGGQIPPATPPDGQRGARRGDGREGRGYREDK
jgi:hypothetical protein